jgi:2-phospho-L-lactate guanylyltransferase
MRVIAVPMKSLSRAKTRLSPMMSSLERGAFALAMLEDVLDATLALGGWDTWVISPDEVALEIAARRGARPVPEVKAPLSAAVRQVETMAREEDAAALAVIPGDLPLVTAHVLGRALRTLGSVIVAPSNGGAGTSLLLRRPPRAIPARFGPDSFRRHLELARERQLPVAVVEDPDLSFDLDVPRDILTLLDSPRRGRAWEVCLEMDLGERMRVNA